MKKFLILTIAMFSLLSCSSEDNLDPFVGTWYAFSYDGIETDNCERKGLLDVKENGTLSMSYYYSENGECIEDGADSGNWSNKGNGNYAIFDSEGSNEFVIKINFSNNNNTMTIISSYEENGQIETETSVYKRK